MSGSAQASQRRGYNNSSNNSNKSNNSSNKSNNSSNKSNKSITKETNTQLNGIFKRRIYRTCQFIKFNINENVKKVTDIVVKQNNKDDIICYTITFYFRGIQKF